MDNHPIPQDVTGFKFRIIGSITIKQFLYLLGSGVTVAILIFLIPLNLIIKIPLIVLLGGIGPFFAFIPIEGRPADLMLVNFFRAVFANSLYIYHKQGANLALFPALSLATPQQKVQQATKTKEQSKADVKRALLARTLRSSTYAPDAQETARIQNINSIFGDAGGATGGINAPSIARPPSIATSNQRPGTSEAQNSVADTTKQKPSSPAPQLVVESPDEPVQAQTKQQGATIANKSVVAQPAQQNKNLNNEEGNPQITNKTIQSDTLSQQKTTTSPVQQNTPQKKQGYFDVLPDKPNVVLGVTLDPRGKALQNIIVEVEDGNGTPVRTLKTDAKGKFASATSLPDGEYTIKFEDPRKQNSFATMRIKLSGQIFEPVIVKSVDEREKLRRDLFANKTAQ